MFWHAWSGDSNGVCRQRASLQGLGASWSSNAFSGWVLMTILDGFGGSFWRLILLGASIVIGQLDPDFPSKPSFAV